jgi:hypothetical protein
MSSLYLLGQEVNLLLTSFSSKYKLVPMSEENFKLTSDAAKELSQLGASKGGKARAKSLTSERRSEIARTAIEARWRKQGKLTVVPQATHGSPDSPLRIGDLMIPAYVLSDGRRVLAQVGMLDALGMTRGGSSRGGDRIAKFAGQDRLKPFVSKALSSETFGPIEFKTPQGNRALGYEATILADICDAVLEARKQEALTKRYERIAAQCEILVRGFARVGIIALVDEATGYQETRAKDALAKILEAFIAKELRGWISTFPADYYKEMFRLRGWHFPDLPADQKKRPILVGKITNDVIYDRLAPGVREELHRLTPRNEKGRLKHKLFQRLTKETGHPKLKEHLASVTTLMRAADTWPQFISMLNRSLPRYGDTPYLPFEG